MNVIRRLLGEVNKAGVRGAVAEVGVYKGGTLRAMAELCPERICYGFDTFEGMPLAGEHDVHQVGSFADTSLEAVAAGLVDLENVELVQGIFPASAAALAGRDFAFVHIDGDQYQTTRDALAWFWPRLSDDGIMVLDDHQWENCPGVALAVQEFTAANGLAIEKPHAHQAVIRKGSAPRETNREVDLYSSGRGIGDAISALYCACGLADAGFNVRFHARHLGWLARLSHPGVKLLPHAEIGIDVNADYDRQIVEAQSRKQWYCDNVARSLGIPAFAPGAPDAVSEPAPSEYSGSIVLAPHSDWRDREWPEIHWAWLARQLALAGHQVFVLSKDLARVVDRFRDCPSGVRWNEQLSAAQVLDVIQNARCVVGNDSGMVHVAAAHNVPAIAVMSHLRPEVVFSHTSVVGMTPSFDCVGCAWQRERGYGTICRRACSAIATLSPVDVLEQVNLILGGEAANVETAGRALAA